MKNDFVSALNMLTFNCLFMIEGLYKHFRPVTSATLCNLAGFCELDVSVALKFIYKTMQEQNYD